MSLFKKEFKKAIKEDTLNENLEGLHLLLDAEMIAKFGSPVNELPIEVFIEYSIAMSEEVLTELKEEGFVFPDKENPFQVEKDYDPIEFSKEFPYEMLAHPEFTDFELPEEDELLDFEEALMYLKMGHKLARKHWNGYWFITDANIAEEEGLDTTEIENFIAARLANGKIAPAQPFQGDLLAEDWIIIK
jgi:hypothetical protein